MKTAATVLQEMMVKMSQIPEYECISQSGPQHQATFEYRCKALGLEATAAARSKKEAKQEVAKVMLRRLAAAGHPVPPPYGLHAPAQASGATATAGAGAVAATGMGDRSYVALLKELCEEYRLPGPEYPLVADTGPPHLRHFTVRAQVGQHAREATATTKKAARQIAAEQLYSYLRENLARVTKDFNEEEALVRAHEKARDRYLETRDETTRRPDLGQKIADYHLGLLSRLEPGDAEAGRAALAQAGGGDPVSELAEAARALRLQPQWAALPTRAGGQLPLVQLEPTAPALALAGADRAAAAAAALRYLRVALDPPAR